MSDQSNTYKGLRRLRSFASTEEIDNEILKSLRFDLSEVKKKGLYIFGGGRLGISVQTFLVNNNFKVNGYVDNNPSLHGKFVNGLEVFPAGKLDPSDIVYIASETYLNPIKQQLDKAGIVRNLSHLIGSILFKGYADFPAGMFLENLTEDLIDNKERYLEVFDLLSDARSKEVFNNLILYRMSGNISFIDPIFSSADQEYFDDSVFSLEENEVFFDCGGYNGDSALNFIKFANGNYKSIHIFEPDQNLLQQAREKLKGSANIFYNAAGVFEKTTVLKFATTGGLDGKIDDQGSVTIPAISLDEYQAADTPTYIKLDIEGAEIEALNGAIRLIEKSAPRLAIASYHFPKHFWEIPLHVLKMNKHYKLSLRHYCDYLLGSTYYFIQK